MSDDQVEARRQWVRTPPSPAASRIHALFRWWHQKLPAIFASEFTVTGFLLGAGHLAALAAVATSPFWIEWTTGGSISTTVMFSLSGLLILLMVLSWCIEQLGTRRKSRERQRRLMDEYAARHFVINDSLLRAIVPANLTLSEDARVQLCEKVLQCMEHLARMHLKKPDSSYFQVSLLLFDGDGCNKVKIAARARPDRRAGQLIDSAKTIAYFVDQCGRTFVVPDMHAQSVFPREGLTDKQLRYRSILFVPIILPNSQSQCCGVVTLDSERPYEFTGPIGDEIATQLMPFMGVVAVLVEGQSPHGGGVVTFRLLTRRISHPIQTKSLNHGHETVTDAFLRLKRGEITADQAADELRRIRREKSAGSVRFFDALAD